MTFYYRTTSYTNETNVPEKKVALWKHITEKKNWRIVKLPNGFYQTEYKDPNCECTPEKDTCCESWLDVTRRETLEGAENAIDVSIEHYNKKLEYLKGPEVVKTFK